MPPTSNAKTSPGANACEIAPTKIRSKLTQKNHLQRRLGSRPSGNRRIENTARPIASTQAQEKIHAAASPPGSDPGAISSAEMAYWALKWAIAKERPVA